MLDEMKIEEAAIGAADLYEQDLEVETYDGQTENDGQIHFCREHGADLFKDGAHWAIQKFLKDLWHDASEKPKKGKMLLFHRKVGYTHFIIDKLNDNNSWNVLVHELDICEWLYIDDLLEQKGGE